MSHEMSHMGPRGNYSDLHPLTSANNITAFNHDNSSDAEAEYDRLRDLARQEASKRGQCFGRVCDTTMSLIAVAIAIGVGLDWTDTL